MISDTKLFEELIKVVEESPTGVTFQKVGVGHFRAMKKGYLTDKYPDIREGLIEIISYSASQRYIKSLEEENPPVSPAKSGKKKAKASSLPPYREETDEDDSSI